MKSELSVIEALEETIREEYSCSGVCLVTNGTHAIQVLLTALNLPRGSRVLVPNLTFIATASAVANCGLIPVYADVTNDYLGLSLGAVKNGLEKGVAAVIVVHMAGFVNRQMEEIEELCKQAGVTLLEDCAQAHRASLNSRRVGNFGKAATFSFQSSKFFNCGEGGAILSNDKGLVETCKAICNWGWPGPGYAANLNIPSSNYRMSYLQCERLLSEFASVERKVSHLECMYNCLAEIATKVDKRFVPASFLEPVVDSPFFFVVEKRANREQHRLEPFSQYPISKSSMIEAILQRWFPDLVAEYRDINSDDEIAKNSKEILDSYAFLRISQFQTGDPLVKEIEGI